MKYRRPHKKVSLLWNRPPRKVSPRLTIYRYKSVPPGLPLGQTDILLVNCRPGETFLGKGDSIMENRPYPAQHGVVATVSTGLLRRSPPANDRRRAAVSSSVRPHQRVSQNMLHSDARCQEMLHDMTVIAISTVDVALHRPQTNMHAC